MDCPICLGKSTQLIFGACQHYICVTCAYNKTNILRSMFETCPICKRENVYPKNKPCVNRDLKETLEETLNYAHVTNEYALEIPFIDITEKPKTRQKKKSYQKLKRKRRKTK